MKIHAIQTGTVAVTAAWREGIGHGRRRLLRAITDREWTEPLPIYAFAIEHPEGVIVVDTGEDARASQPGYFPRWHPGVRAFREWVEPEQEIGAQLERLGIQPGDVRWLVLTHLHTDHAGGLHHFPDNEILVTRSELEFASGLRGRLRGYVANTHWPAWFSPTQVELEPVPYGPFPQSLRLTKAGDVVLVPLPGHTPGQIGVLVDQGDTPSSSPATRPTRKSSCFTGNPMASGRTRTRNGSRTNASAPWPQRTPRSTSSRTTPRPEPAWPSGGSCSRSWRR
jgi:N-acyl homoserine lactone hydrolase